MAVVAVMAGDVALTKYGPATRAAAVETGASFSVSAASFTTEAKAATFAAALDASGLPILVRVRPDDGRFQVLVGPYVSTEEAERAQRKLAAWGLGEARFVVDDTMRARPQEAAMFGFGRSSSTSVVMVAAAGMSSIVFEMSSVPKQVETRRAGSTSMDVEIGLAAESAPFEPLLLPDGVSLVRELSVRSDGRGSTRAHVVVPDGVESRLRLEGRRVYVDLAFPKAPWRIAPRASDERPASDSDERPATDSPERPATDSPERRETRRVVSEAPSGYREQVDAIVARFTEIEPFLLSAVQAPEADVLAALAHSLVDVRTSLEGTPAAADTGGNRQALLVAVAKAQAAVARTFAGDRRAAVEEAVALFHSH